MRGDNVLLVAVCTAAVVAAATIAWRGRRLPVVAARDTPTSPSTAAFDALRTLACVLTAGFVAGLLVVGFGGRLAMRVLAATSGSTAQGRSTDAGGSWQQVLALTDSTGAIDVAVHPTDSSVLYAAMWERIREPNRITYGGPNSGLRSVW